MATRPVPRIINTHVVPFKDGKTLVWYKDQDPTLKGWRHWDGVVTSLADFDKWSPITRIIGLVLTGPITPGDLLPYRGRIPQLFLSQATVSSIPVADWQMLGIPIMILDNLFSGYPHLGHTWLEGSEADAVAIACALFAYRRLVGWFGGSAERTAHLEGLGVRLCPTLPPPEIWLLTQYFVHKTGKRAREFRQCLRNNLSNPLVDKVVLLNEKDLSSEWAGQRGADKVIQEIIGERLTYRHLLQYVHEKVPDNVIAVFANADIYLNETLNHLYGVNMLDKVFALLRYDEQEDGSLKLFGPRVDSQDTWILQSDSVRARTWDWASFDYKLGTAGCDNRFTADMFAMRFVVSNPCNTLQTVHIHRTAIRDYNPRDILDARFYLYVHPAPILEFDQSKNTPHKAGALVPRQATVRIQCPTPKQAETFSVMLGRLNRFKWSPTEPSPYQSKPLTVHKWTNAWVLGAGLVHDYRAAYLDEKAATTFLQTANLPLAIELIKRPETADKMLAIPANKMLTFQHPDAYLLHYFTTALQLLQHLNGQGVNGCSFYMPEALASIASKFKVPASAATSAVTGATGEETGVQVIQWRPDVSTYSSEVYGLLPEGTEWGVEDVRTLRGAWRGERPAASEKKQCMVLMDELFCNVAKERLAPHSTEVGSNEVFMGDRLERIGECLGAEWEVIPIGSTDTGPAVYEKLMEASLCILYNLPERPATHWMKLWAAPAGCKVLEFQSELKVTGEFQHFAAACEFQTYLFPLHKAPIEGVFAQAIEALQGWLKTH
jgi:hypothetical protein